MSGLPEANEGGGPTLLGVDIGTTNLKVSGFTLDGGLVTTVSRPVRAITPGPDQGEYDGDALYLTVCESLRDITGVLEGRGHRVVGLAVSSMAETAFPVDEAGRPVRNGLAWWDGRSKPQAERMSREHGQSAWYGIAGMHLSALVGVTKIVYLREEEPDVLRRTRTWLNVADWIAYRLTGVMSTDRTLGCRLGLMDVTVAEWSDDLLTAAGIDVGLFAPLVNSGDRIGGISREAAALTGLPVGTTVGAGGMDHPVAAFGAGVWSPGQVLDSMGTTEALLGVLEQPVLTLEMAEKRYQQGVFVIPGRNFVVGGLATSGSAVDWLNSLLWDDSVENRDYGRLVESARGSEPGAGGLAFLPLLLFQPNGVRTETGSGVILGLRPSTRQGDIVRALLEGIACTVRSVMLTMHRDFGLQPESVVAVGGGTRNPVLMEIKAALAGGRITVGPDESGTRGAAMLAGLAAGIFDGHDDAVTSMVGPQRATVEAPIEMVATYKRILEERFEPVHRALLPHFGLFGQPLPE